MAEKLVVLWVIKNIYLIFRTLVLNLDTYILFKRILSLVPNLSNFKTIFNFKTLKTSKYDTKLNTCIRLNIMNYIFVCYCL